MKKKNSMNTRLFLSILVVVLQVSIAKAQWDVQPPATGMNTVVGISRWGNVGIGQSVYTYIPQYPLHIISGNNTGLKLVHLNDDGSEGITDVGIDFTTYNHKTNYTHRVSRIASSDAGNFGGSLLFYTKAANGTGSASVTERMRISAAGNIGLGSTFTNASSPASLLHLRSAAPNIFLDGSSGPNSGGTINFGYGGTPYFALNQNLVSNGSTSGVYMRLGATGGRGITIQPTGVMAFSTSYTFGFGSATMGNYLGLSGKYIFDDQVSAPQLLIGTPTLAPYATILSGYSFSVAGNSTINGRIQVNNATSTVPDNTVAGLNISNTSTYSWIQTENGKPLALNPKPNTNPTTTNTSYVAIGFAPGDAGVGTVGIGYKLAVKGKVICEELKVKYSGTWPDHVFGQDYKLRDLNEVEKFITENKHLPDVPSEVEVQENGIEAGQMDATLLKKIEELTLYMIEMNKEIQGLKKSNETLTERNNALEKLLVK